jgi:hypothetical protein
MIAKKFLKEGQYGSLLGYFEGILENLINGNNSSVWLMISEMSKPQSVTFLNWLSEQKKDGDTNDYEKLTSITLQILKR